MDDKSNVSGTGPGGSFTAKVVRIFETLTGLVKVGPDESMRDVHRGNQIGTVTRYQRRMQRAEAGLYGAGKFRKAQLAGRPGRAKSKHALGHMKAPPLCGAHKEAPQQDGYWPIITDRPRGRVYPAHIESKQWVSVSQVRP